MEVKMQVTARLSSGTASDKSELWEHDLALLALLPARDEDQPSVVHSIELGVIILEIFRLIEISSIFKC